MEQKKDKPKKTKLIIFTTTFVYLMILIVGYLNLTSIQDYVKLYNYKAPSAISYLATQDTMTDYTRHLFYLNSPQILDTVTSFRNQCSETKNIIVLGCYKIGQKGIYIYKVNNPLLAGINQVTAAHEVLHSVYERLSVADRNQLNKDLQYYYDNKLTDTNVKAEISLYQKYEPNSVYDEMSCTYGTELKDLTPNLEKYYSKYFSNRLTIYNYYSSYESQFNSRIAKIYSYDTNLTSMNSNIKSQQLNLSSLYSQINTLKAKMDSLKNTNVISYNSLVSSHNSLVNEYNSLRDSNLVLVDQYNSIVLLRNSIVDDLKKLDQAIDTTIITSS